MVHDVECGSEQSTWGRAVEVSDGVKVIGCREDGLSNKGLVRAGGEGLSRRAAFLPLAERRLIREICVRGTPLETVARRKGVTAQALRRRVKAIRRRIEDPCFLLAVQFADKLPKPLGELARLSFREGISVAGCAELCAMTEHEARKSLHAARAIMIAAGIEKYGGADPRKRAVVGALLRSPLVGARGSQTVRARR